jgi:hypothetical protein
MACPVPDGACTAPKTENGLVPIIGWLGRQFPTGDFRKKGITILELAARVKELEDKNDSL